MHTSSIEYVKSKKTYQDSNASKEEIGVPSKRVFNDRKQKSLNKTHKLVIYI